LKKTNPKPKPEDPYRVLGVDRNADGAQIKKAYFQLVREYSPESAPEQFQRIRAAYDQLRSPERRAQADLLLLQPPPPAPQLTQKDFDLSLHREDIIRAAVELKLRELNPRDDFQLPSLPEDLGKHYTK
jgi:curved DNA-binding protein CbpA